MATAEVEQVKALTDGATGLTDSEIQAILTAQGNVNDAARYIWRTKAAGYSSLVNISESGSTRAMGDLYKNALAMADAIGKEEIRITHVKRSRKAGRR